MKITQDQNGRRFSRLQLSAYAFPAMVLAMATVPVSAILPTLYAQHTRVSVVAVGSVFLARSIYDAFSDMIIGYLSDRTVSRLGPRQPWIIAGAAITMLAGAMLYRVPADASVLYFGAWTLLFYTGSTMIAIPFYAWGSELSAEYNESTRVFSYKGIFESLGTFAVSSTPLLLVMLGVLATTEYSIDAVRVLGGALLILMPISIFVSVTYAPRAKPSAIHDINLLDVLHAVRKNRPFLRFICAYIIAGFGYGLFVALIFPYVTSYLGVGEAFPMILLLLTISQMASIPVWTWITQKIGKHRAWAWGWVVNSLVMLPLWFVAPGPQSAIPLTIVLCLYAATNGVSAIAPFALLGNVADYDRLKTGRNHAGQFFALMMFAAKLLGSAGGVGLIVLGGVFSYDLAVDAQNDGYANFGIKLLFIVLPGLFQLASVALIWNFPINERRQQIIARRLQQRDDAEAKLTSA